MNINIDKQNYNYHPNFGCKKLANLVLPKKLQNSTTTYVSAELLKLDAFDLPKIKTLYQNKSNTLPKNSLNIFKDIYESFIDTFSNQTLSRKPNNVFYIIKHDNEVQAICEATLTPKEMCLDYIVNLNKGNGIKGAGTSLIAYLVKLAQKAKKQVLSLNAIESAYRFMKAEALKK